MKRCLLFAALLFCSATAAYADDDTLPSFYLEAGIGQDSVNYNTYSQDAVNQGVISGNTTSESLIAGVGLNQNLAAELGYHDYGHPTVGQQTGQSVNQCPQAFSCPNVSAITAELVGRLEIMTDLTGEVLGGIQAWNVSSPGSTVIGKSSGQSAVVGLRVRHDFHDQFEGWSFDVTYEYSRFSTAEARVGLRYTF